MLENVRYRCAIAKLGTTNAFGITTAHMSSNKTISVEKVNNDHDLTSTRQI